MRITAVLCMLLAGIARADFDSALIKTMQAVPVSTDGAGMGGLNITMPAGTGTNPAQNALVVDTEFNKSVLGQGYLINLSHGPTLAIKAGNASIRLGQGALKLNYYQVDTISRGSKSILDPNAFTAESLEISYGFKLTDTLSVGMSVFPESKFELESKVGSLRLGSAEGKVKGAGSLGLFWKLLDEKLILAGTWNISAEKDKQTELGFTTTSHVMTNVLRLGMAVQPWKGGTIGVEWLGMKIDRSPGETAWASKIFYGAEQYLNERFCLRAGCLNGAPTAGVGVVLGKKKNIYIDYAYLANPIEMDHYWGSSSGHMIDVCIAW